ncbi:formylglycine-generating enzyme family protein [Cellvibrio japonicus]|uniref:Conserved domain protein n=1 Tax=Cellvibrio japonicus (strain Ueda107) TaxID=498211 RepID=B3PGM5_CELJU|nr:formylglycine-generating enzyme family protein [Cellvibrio japonicus]ACE84113.1 conserved domain protein [Cellvibrio japonicus Ueda107]QEI12373.1 formylglycine-generating enzyme family protein [Cellvibrio japonicus]QEI15946.1 formylglycine-generating enzyme family protein [Cellvibrio japonicus]QEI19525.1 formylglycine-generating enzyme family protein [Cellvibrio japonicus]
MKKIFPVLITLLFMSPHAGIFAAEKFPRPGTLLKDCDVCPEIVVLPAGSYIMGTPDDEIGRQPDEGPQRTVTFAKPFAIGIYPVTAAEWDAFIQATNTPRRSGDTRPGRACTDGKPTYSYSARQPAVCMTFEDTENYVKWLTKKTGKTYRLPSEAEWEYAARAGSTGPFPFPFDEEGVYKINKNANTYGHADGYEYTSPVGSYPPNKFGLFDMHGNVHERLMDCVNDSYDNAPTDGSPWMEGDCDERIMRGNDWIEPPIFSRSGNRNSRPVGLVGDWLGLRVVREL